MGRAELVDCNLSVCSPEARGPVPVSGSSSKLQRFGLIAFEKGHAAIRGGEILGHLEDGVRVESEASLLMEDVVIKDQASCGVRVTGSKDGPLDYLGRGPTHCLVRCTFNGNKGGPVAYSKGAFPAVLGCTCVSASPNSVMSVVCPEMPRSPAGYLGPLFAFYFSVPQHSGRCDRLIYSPPSPSPPPPPPPPDCHHLR